MSSSWDSEVEVVSEFDEGVQREVVRIEGQLSRFLESEYQAAIFSDSNFVPAHLLAQKEELQAQLQTEVMRQTEIANQVNEAEFLLKELQAKIAALRDTENGLVKARADEAVGKKEAEMHEAMNRQAREQQQIRVSAKVEKLKSQVQRKRKNDEKVIQFLSRAIQKEEEVAEQLKIDIEEMRKKVAIQATMGGLPVSPH